MRIEFPSGTRTYRIGTYGCQMNAHESEKIAGMLEAIGLEPAREEAPADVLVLNTCCIRDSAEQRIIGHIGTLKKLKAENPDMIIAVVGCLSARPDAARTLARTFPFLDIILGTADLQELPGQICALRGVEAPEEAKDSESVVRREEGPLSYVNIMYGCNNFCSYCIVPYVRGRERSRPEEDIIREVRGLAEDGYREVTLLGQNVNSYQGGGDRFAELLRQVAGETSIDRIRFMTSHPKDMSEELIRAVAECEKVCSHVHLPVQSGSDRILESMNRRYTRARYLELVNSLREKVPGVVLTTDVIVGYPGETEEDFRSTMSLMEQVRFDAAYTFVYSPRTGTAAAKLDGQISGEVKKRRIVELIDLQNAVTREINAGMIGRTEKVLVEGPSARGADMCGRTDGGKMVNFEGPRSLRGCMVDVRITAPRGSTLYGVMEENA